MTQAMPPWAQAVFDSARPLGDDRDRAVRGRLQRKGQPGDAAADDDEVEFPHDLPKTAEGKCMI